NKTTKFGTEREPVCDAKDSARPLRHSPFGAAGRSRPHPGRVHSADCGLRNEEILQLLSPRLAIPDCRLRFKKSAIRNPYPLLSYFPWMVYMNMRVLALIGKNSSIPSFNF